VLSHPRKDLNKKRDTMNLNEEPESKGRRHFPYSQGVMCLQGQTKKGIKEDQRKQGPSKGERFGSGEKNKLIRPGGDSKNVKKGEVVHERWP